jgi:FMN phosphatase YigB (HAD superfamily)
MRRPRAILFDWDNTLVDSWGTIHEALNFLMAAMERPLWSLAETKERVRLSLRESFPRHFGDRWEEARDIYLARFREIHLQRLTALPGRAAMLRALKAEGIYLGVVSNKTGPVLRNERRRGRRRGLVRRRHRGRCRMRAEQRLRARPARRRGRRGRVCALRAATGVCRRG